MVTPRIGEWAAGLHAQVYRHGRVISYPTGEVVRHGHDDGPGRDDLVLGVHRHRSRRRLTPLDAAAAAALCTS